MGLGVVLGWVATVFCVLFVWAVLSGPGSGKRVVVRVTDRPPSDLAEDLASMGVVRSPGLLRWYWRLFRPALALRRGEHLLNDGLSPREISQRLSGSTARQRVRAPFPEGFNLMQIAARLDELEVCGRQSFEQAAHDRALLTELGIQGESAEGYLFPASYELLADSEPRAVLGVLVVETQRRLDRIRARHPGAFEDLKREFAFGTSELIAFASMVEKETAKPDERAIIASVFYNRLRRPDFTPNRMLQSDPTAVYGCLVAPLEAPSCREYHGRVTPAMLRDALNRYNTYRHPGLPPGPIANPGEQALEAALAPARTDYLFFVANGSGGHTFSRTFEEHARAIRAAGAP
jgi:UPF0755 protein